MKPKLLIIQFLLIILLLISSFGTCKANFQTIEEKIFVQNEIELKKRMVQLREQYAPYLRSLPEPVTIRSRIPIDGNWLSQYEIEEASDSIRPEVPDWFSENYNDRGWSKTTVPEWRYRGPKRTIPVSCILWYRTTFTAEPVKSDKRIFLVFEGVDWEAEVWLNGKLLGNHKVYYEPFRFDVTSLVKKNNTLAVRVIDGPIYGEPAAFWTLFPVPYADQQHYVRDKSRSLVGIKNGDWHIGSGYGIHREVYLETTGKVSIMDLFARGDIEKSHSLIRVHFNAAEVEDMHMEIKIMPENFEGKIFETSILFKAIIGDQSIPVTVKMPGAKKWTPETPYLYRCRVTLRKDSKILDVYDVLYGYRSFSMVSEINFQPGMKPGTFLLNGKPIFLKGANIQGMNALWYWGEEDKMLDVMLMLKAANFNAVRSCQHVQYPEVRELQDRLGIMSQQDQGSRFPNNGKQVWPGLMEAVGTLTQICYNNPGVVLLSFANETRFDPTEMVERTLTIDPDRIMIPISGQIHGGEVLPPADGKINEFSDALWANVIDDFHPYWGWYGWQGQIGKWCKIIGAGRKLTVGEYGAEGLDSYQTMSKNYPSHWNPIPPKETDVLFGNVQTEKNDNRQLMGFRGKKPINLQEYIEASQNFQADVLSEVTKSWRMSVGSIAGYFQFHFIDVLPANWPKSIISHDLNPKKAYYAMAQVNQPLVPLPRMIDQGKMIQLWIANDLNQPLDDQCIIRWVIRLADTVFVQGEKTVNIPVFDALQVHQVDLSAVPVEVDIINISLLLLDTKGNILSRYDQDFYLDAWRKAK